MISSRASSRLRAVSSKPPEPRLAALVVPGSGPVAVGAHHALLRWLRRHVSDATPFVGAAWVIPDPDVRGSVAALIDNYHHAVGGTKAALLGF